MIKKLFFLLISTFLLFNFTACDESQNPVKSSIDTLFIITNDTIIQKDSIFNLDTVVINNLDTIIINNLDTVFSKDTVINLDTVFSKDTVINLDTVFSIDTIINLDTVFSIDTIINLDTVFSIDTIYYLDTLTNCRMYSFFGYFTDSKYFTDTWQIDWEIPSATSSSWVQLIYFRGNSNSPWEDISTGVYLNYCAPPSWWANGVDIIDIDKDLLGYQYKIILIEEIVIVRDTTYPTIVVNPPNPYYMGMGNQYTERGASAYDNIDGNLTSKINTSGTVDINKEGIYKITYSVTDNAGNKTDSVRLVNISTFTEIK